MAERLHREDELSVDITVQLRTGHTCLLQLVGKFSLCGARGIRGVSYKFIFAWVVQVIYC